MPPRLRITRNREANELSAHIQNDAELMSAITSAVREFWDRFTAVGLSSIDSSPMLVPQTTDLIIALIEHKVANLKAIPQERRAAVELEALLRKAGLYPVADDILQASLPEYRPMSETGLFELVDESTSATKPWWQFW